MTAIGDAGALRRHYDAPHEKTLKKILPRLDEHARAFIGLCPLLIIASCGPDGADCSPRGDAPGFVRVLDDRTLLIPDRSGNNILDTLGNVLSDPEVGLLFLVPGMNETLRANGTARIVTDAHLLKPMAVSGKVPGSALEVRLRQVYFHCGRSLIRAEVWNPERQIDRKSFPSLGRILADQIAGVDAEAADDMLEDAYSANLY